MVEITALPVPVTPAKKWISDFKGLRSMPAQMASPPTASLSGVSTINSNTGGACSHTWDNPVLKWGLETPVIGVRSPSATIETITTTTNTKYEPPLRRLRFKTDASAFELVLGYSTEAHLALFVDGEEAFSSNPLLVNYGGGNQYVKFDFGAPTTEYELLSATVGGTMSGYVLGEEMTMAGGTGTSPIVVRATYIGGGGTSIQPSIKSGGAYTARPPFPISQASSTGSGTGLTITGGDWGRKPTTKKTRHIELWIGGQSVGFKGVNVDSKSVIQPWPIPDGTPRVLFVGDSQLGFERVGRAQDYPTYRIAARLGLLDGHMLQSVSGSGWNINNTAWSSAGRIADIIAAAPDIVAFIGSQNDVQNSALQTAVTSTLDTLCAALPNTLFVGIGSVLCTGSAYTKAGWLGAADQGRCKYIDNVTDPWLTGGGYATNESSTGNKSFLLGSDAAHLSPYGRGVFADMAAAAIADALKSASY